MSGTSDEWKGKGKEAAGKVTGDESLEREGQADQAKGKLKGAAKKIKDAVTPKSDNPHHSSNG
jgi:uncharacterized protein YjbJ (UPF0337 family)